MPTVYITAPPEAADSIAHALVEDRLAACVNLVPCRSVYRWEGTVHEDDEVALLAKTTAEQYDALVNRVVELHPYDVPCIERFDETSILDVYAEWRDDAIDSTK
ncbi:divalent-cation tolerance protein CutA [Haladaptatus sp. ZSTT2]|uniref:divalent-cation tolerance protein CutA n=1 Tax=Haladaptatus sp. ZSTT2 TaxID=3120515 RepID=UPI00300F024F